VAVAELVPYAALFAPLVGLLVWLLIPVWRYSPPQIEVQGRQRVGLDQEEAARREERLTA
jgi:hypothetical protein